MENYSMDADDKLLLDSGIVSMERIQELEDSRSIIKMRADNELFVTQAKEKYDKAKARYVDEKEEHRVIEQGFMDNVIQYKIRRDELKQQYSDSLRELKQQYNDKRCERDEQLARLSDRYLGDLTEQKAERDRFKGVVSRYHADIYEWRSICRDEKLEAIRNQTIQDEGNEESHARLMKRQANAVKDDTHFANLMVEYNKRNKKHPPA